MHDDKVLLDKLQVKAPLALAKIDSIKTVKKPHHITSRVTRETPDDHSVPVNTTKRLGTISA